MSPNFWTCWRTHGKAHPTGNLQTVAHSAHAWQSRANRELSDEIRKKEPADFDGEIADVCCQTVEAWWRNGQVQVVQDGQIVPASFDLGEALRNGPVEVWDRVINLLSDPPTHSEEVNRLVDEISNHSWRSEKEKESKGFAG